MNSKIRNRFIAVAVIVVVILGLWIYHTNNQYGTANIDFTLPNTTGLVATVNGKKLAVTELRGTYKLHSGNEKLVVNEPNFSEFTTNFTLGTGQTVLVSVNMQSIAPTSAAVANSQLTASLISQLPQGSSIQNTTYFYGNTWVVATTQTSSGNSAIFVGKYVGGEKPWQIAAGPGTVFLSTNLSNVPGSIVTYLEQQGDVLEVVT